MNNNIINFEDYKKTDLNKEELAKIKSSLEMVDDLLSSGTNLKPNQVQELLILKVRILEERCQALESQNEVLNSFLEQQTAEKEERQAKERMWKRNQRARVKSTAPTSKPVAAKKSTISKAYRTYDKPKLILDPEYPISKERGGCHVCKEACAAHVGRFGFRSHAEPSIYKNFHIECWIDSLQSFEEKREILQSNDYQTYHNKINEQKRKELFS